MWFFIDTHRPGQFRAGWLGPKAAVKVYKKRADKLLQQSGASKTWKKRCTGICVVAGPGSFSAVRLGVLYANLLARLSPVPLIGVSVQAAEHLPMLYTKLVAGQISSTIYVAPVYDAEPNITVPKQP